ncbi:MAG: YvcK family protein [Verrucomicrobia bacterium]|nr:YvcK family protein [Verrucomicrobiota bacterium]
MNKVVVVGGGTGTFTVLRGIKQYPLDITAVVSTFDSGGSTGILRDEFGMLPLGDTRRCLIALAPDSEDTTLRDLFNYRYADGGSFKGHSFGNLFLQALRAVTGSDVSAIKKAAALLNCRGKVLPVSTDPSNLCATLENGQTIKGESNIDVPKHDGDIRIRNVYLEPRSYIFAEAYEVLKAADLIVVGPGDLYTSIIPNFLVEGFADAIRERRGKLAYVLNIMTKWGETNGFVASEFAKEVLSYLKQDTFDYIICNSAPVADGLVKKYVAEKAHPVKLDIPELQQLARSVILEEVIQQTDIVRHDSNKLARVLCGLTR